MKRIEFWNENEYNYPLAFEFRPNLRYYPAEDGGTHPCMIILPGGGYAVVVPPEGEIVAKEFNKLGYNCFVMTYTTNQLMREPVMDQAMRDLARAIRFVRKNSEEYKTDPSKVYICGFSAAGHVCASVCDYWSEITDDNPDYRDISCRPDAAVLSYPVITSGKYAHQDSFRFLLGADIYDRNDDESRALLDRYSLELHVNRNNPPCYVWQTETDDLVPVQNSYLYAEALKENGIPYMHKTFPEGWHGLSVPNEDWADGNFGEPYTLEQTFALVNAIKTGVLKVSQETADSLVFNPDPDMPKPKPMPEVCVWPEQADAFIRSLGQ